MDFPPPPLPHLLWTPHPPLTLPTTIPSSLERILSTRPISASDPYRLSHRYPRLLWNGRVCPRGEGGANLAVPIGTTTPCKCRGKHVDSCVYALTCELSGRPSNIESWKLYTAHMPGRLNGVVGEGKSFSWGDARNQR